METYVISNGYGSGKYTGTYEEAILQCLKDVNAMCTCWLYMVTPNGWKEIGRTHKVLYYDGYSFKTKDNKEYVRINNKIRLING